MTTPESFGWGASGTLSLPGGGQLVVAGEESGETDHAIAIGHDRGTDQRLGMIDARIAGLDAKSQEVLG